MNQFLFSKNDLLLRQSLFRNVWKKRNLCYHFSTHHELGAPLEQLGRKVGIPSSPQEAVLERVPNSFPNVQYVARFVAPEFTSLCPVTGQPDFAHLVIDYIPNKWLLESKSLKLFLHSFRNHGDFHESCTIFVAKRIEEKVEPIWLRIGGYWYPRGGIPIDVFYQSGEPPKGVWVPEHGVAGYRGRG